ncbi:hypothetical protein [Burkholderia sp. 22PA0106]|uniref:hypothetical protein n=1 Tax=Burkholderia sp. 22PA0106 TaxID=3237371 RepID=UPI0039C12C24
MKRLHGHDEEIDMNYRPAGKRAFMRYVGLLYFLVIAQLAAKQKLNMWLSITQLVELLREWIAHQGMKCDWRDRICLIHASFHVAHAMHAAYGPTFVVSFLSTRTAFDVLPADARENQILLREACSRYLKHHVQI